MMEEVLKAKKPETISWHFRHTYFRDSMTEESKIKNDGSESNNVKSSEPSLQPDIPSHLLTHVFRSANHSKGKIKGYMGSWYALSNGDSCVSHVKCLHYNGIVTVYNLTTLIDCFDSGTVWQPQNYYFDAPSSGMDYSKSFISTEKALIIMNHYPLASLQNNWTSREVTNDKHSFTFTTRLDSNWGRRITTGALVRSM